MPTIAYVDGYNLYHGRLKHTPFKWLDLVSLLSSILRDAVSGSCDQVLLCTNDSDLAPAIEFIRRDCPGVIVGVVLPRPPELKARKSRTLQDLAHWTRDHILDAELSANQLPRRVQTGSKPADKPAHW